MDGRGLLRPVWIYVLLGEACLDGWAWAIEACLIGDVSWLVEGANPSHVLSGQKVLTH